MYKACCFSEEIPLAKLLVALFIKVRKGYKVYEMQENLLRLLNTCVVYLQSDSCGYLFGRNMGEACVLGKKVESIR